VRHDALDARLAAPVLVDFEERDDVLLVVALVAAVVVAQNLGTHQL
jgi:hypothetical protein